ncbi:delta-1-pyrroline-5-carboxylate dehydrogenase [Exidia glandulosa HHB12029]|uniref:Multifunctional fusion protein n=1 Tax=Exidia glandulosa HHB12029 TaxID=1314781 RepID=A0A165GYF8_EXIGL|nr:delta-1-pyrroline-5-carboxylate dehydrogenase [Exidia glandulosa HHB12029]
MSFAQLGSFTVPPPTNEPTKNYAPGSPERVALEAALKDIQQALPFEVPCVVNGKEVRTGNLDKQPIPSTHAKHLCTFHNATPEVLKSAIDGALKAQKQWESLPWADRAAIFLRAADLAATKYRYQLVAATMLGQGKTIWQAEIDAACELIDFWRFGAHFVQELYAIQPKSSEGVWNRVEYRPLEGFVLAVSPFNFTAIGGNLVGAPALVGNVVVWKPAPAATYASYIVFKILVEAGIPPGVIQFVPGPAEEVVGQAIAHPSFAALHFTGSTHVFRKLWKDIGNNIEKYRAYPRIVGETGGKNWHVVHPSADVKNAVMQTVRGAFEYQGQKCSACSRLYVPRSLWEQGGFKQQLLDETAKIAVGDVTKFTNFLGPVIGRPAWDRITSTVAKAKEEGAQVLVGGGADDSTGYFVQPTVLLTTDPQSLTMSQEIFGPVLTVYVYEDSKWEETLDLLDSTSIYALTGAIFAQDRNVLAQTAARLRHAAGNVYLNDKCTGAVVGQQPFGGGRASGTNDKSGSIGIFYRFTSARAVKESFAGLQSWGYPSNLA